MTDNRWVKIKGTKDGLNFLLDDACSFSELLAELRTKLEKTHQSFLNGPSVQVRILLGKRTVAEAQREELKGLFKTHDNLHIAEILTDRPPSQPELQIAGGIIRSGQSRHYEGNVLFLGDVNPGGTISASGDIYLLGTLKGVAHAGAEGNEQAVIAASHLKPTQLRIAGVFSRPPDEWGVDETFMEFAYLTDGAMKIDKIAHLQRIRPNLASSLGGVKPWEKLS